MMKTKLHRFRALALCALLLLSLLPVTSALADGDGAIHIKTEEDLQSFARSCTLDSWSRGKSAMSAASSVRTPPRASSARARPQAPSSART